MDSSKEPKIDLAKRTLPSALFNALKIIFSNKPEGVVLVGGTALAGFYAGHRSSDDIDLFTSSPESQSAAISAVRALLDNGARFGKEFKSRQYFKTTSFFQNHNFTIDVVLDENFFTFAGYKKIEYGFVVADLQTILMTKISTLLSRCSEKDFYDLIWLLRYFPKISFAEIINLGQKIDAGFNGESLLLSIHGSNIKEESCGFAAKQGVSSKAVFGQIISFKKKMEKALSLYLHNSKDSTGLSEVIKYIRSLEQGMKRK